MKRRMTRTVKEIVDTLMEALLRGDHYLFAHVPGLKGAKWPKRALKEFRRNIPGAGSYDRP